MRMILRCVSKQFFAVAHYLVSQFLSGLKLAFRQSDSNVALNWISTFKIFDDVLGFKEALTVGNYE